MAGSTGIIGGGIAGLAAAWQLHQLGQDFTLYEATYRLGGPIETVRRDGFTIELGPDGWVTEKPWAAELACELGLGAELIESNDATRVTWIVQNGHAGADARWHAHDGSGQRGISRGVAVVLCGGDCGVSV